MPGGDGGIALVEGDAEGFCGGLAGGGGGVGVEDGGGADEGAGCAPCCRWGSKGEESEGGIELHGVGLLGTRQEIVSATGEEGSYQAMSVHVAIESFNGGACDASTTYVDVVGIFLFHVSHVLCW